MKFILAVHPWDRTSLPRYPVHRYKQVLSSGGEPVPRSPALLRVDGGGISVDGEGGRHQWVVGPGIPTVPTDDAAQPYVPQRNVGKRCARSDLLGVIHII